MSQPAGRSLPMGDLRISTAIASQLRGGPWAITPDGHQSLMASLGSAATLRRDFLALDPERIRAVDSHRKAGKHWAMGSDYFDSRRDAHVRASGIGILPVSGPLFTRGEWCYTGYDDIAAMGWSMLGTPGLKAIVMPIDSPGGACQGLRELCATIRAWRDEVDIYTVADYSVASAAAAIYCQGTETWCPVDGIAGNLGVFSDWTDITEMLKRDGIAHGYIAEGAMKTYWAGDDTDTSPEEQRRKRDAAMVPIVRALYGLLMDDVAEGRGASMDAEAARRTQGNIYMGQGVVDVGLADEIGTLSDLLANLEGEALSEVA